MTNRHQYKACFLALALAFGGWSATARAQWTALTHVPVAASPAVSGGLGTTTPGGPAYLDTCELLTDATVMCHEYATNHWHRLNPDINGSFQNGTWDTPLGIADMPNGSDPNFGCNNCIYAPLFFASAVLPDGRVIVIGGEDVNMPTGGAAETNIGFVYDPTTNSWSAQLPEKFGGGNVGDAQSVIISNGTFLLASHSGNIESLDAATLTFTVLNPIGKLDSNQEEGWNILPSGSVLTIDSQLNSSFELFDPAADAWGNSGSTPVNLVDLTPGGSNEVGPAVQRPDGTLVAFSANSTGQNAVYDTATGVWLAHDTAMDFPAVPGQTFHFTVHDGPASILPNGNVLVMASPSDDAHTVSFDPPSHFYEFGLGTNSISQVADSPNAPSLASFQGRMLVLPTGEVLLTAFNECLFSGCAPIQDLQLYSNGAPPQDAWRPSIVTFNSHVAPGATDSISGTGFNGFSEGAFYGDDAQMSTNYPLVRITSTATGHVFYARTHNHSNMGVEAVGSSQIVTTQFDVPANIEIGECTLSVVASGIASGPVSAFCGANQPPVAQCKDLTTIADSSCQGTFTVADINNGSFDPDGDPLTLSLTPTGPVGLGITTVTLTATDPSGASSSCTASVTVVDATAPVLTLPPNVTTQSCTGSGTIDVGEATAADICFQGLVPTGEVISENGLVLIPPIPVVGGQVTLGFGTFVVQWSVTDPPGNSATADQTVVVGTNIQASQSFLLDDRAQIRNSGGGFAAVLNSGPGRTQIGNDSESGSVLSVGPIAILDRAVVDGNVISESTVSVAPDAVVSASVVAAEGTVTLPPLPTLPSFPSPTSGAFTINSGLTASQAPGSYTDGTVNGGTLILSSGNYYFRNLALNSASTVRATPTTAIFVQESLVFNAPIVGATGAAVQPIFLGFAGSNLNLDAEFNGTLVAPEATVDFGTGSGLTYTGSFFAQAIQVTPGSTLVCQ